MYYIELLAGLLFLIVGGNVLVDGSVMVARKLKVSPLLIGVLLVGFGTSMPELATSLISVARQAGGIAVGSVVGANIANILLVLGVAALIRPIKIHKLSFGRDAVFLGLSTIVLLVSVLIFLSGQLPFSRQDPSPQAVASHVPELQLNAVPFGTVVELHAFVQLPQ